MIVSRILSTLRTRAFQPVASSRLSRLRAVLMLAVFAFLVMSQPVAHAMPVSPSTATVVPTINTIVGNGTAGFTGDGGLATSAELNSPYGVVKDSAGNLYIADTSNYRIRVV
ncbi:MAG TPA: hypothetical protein VMU62_09225, partial [Acidobacteriaceae bacterium]|nr:hypothetical protein [Acidobacteriaceae bacterium]